MSSSREVSRSRVWRAVLAPATVAGAAMIACGLAFGGPAPAAWAGSDLGTSVRGRQIEAIHRPAAGTARHVLVVVGQIHGNEPAGMRVVAELAGMDIPADIDLWLVPSLNPDGLAARSRTNARGVDLNRNFTKGWRRTPVSGSSRASEPETRAAMAFLRRVRPDALVTFHQSLYGVDVSTRKTRAFAKDIARHARLPRKVFRCSYGCFGTMTDWFNSSQRGRAVTVELNAHPSGALIRRSARAVLAATSALRPRADAPGDPTSPPPGTPQPDPSVTPEVPTTPIPTAPETPVATLPAIDPTVTAAPAGAAAGWRHNGPA